MLGSDAEQRIWRLAAAQAGYLTRGQAFALGATRSMIDARLRAGLWTRLKPGLYLLAGHVESERGLLAAACAAVGGVVSHQSAAKLHDMWCPPAEQPTVTVAVRRTHRFEGVEIHQSTDLGEADVGEVLHLPVTTPARTIIDLAAVVRPKTLERIVDRALAHRRCSMPELHGLARRLARKGKPGTVALRDVLLRRDPEEVPTESELEYLLADRMRHWGLPEPVRQLDLPWRSPRPGRVDFGFPDQRVIVEADGRAWHATAEAFDSDRKRDNLAQIAGWRVIRVTWRMLQDEPFELRQLLHSALRPPASA